ncbi:EamA family transporter [Microbacterium hominis]|uniref:EamA family transporter n=1 Tax=Microbacterium hominis TaxID=162426 RepID=UPI00077C78A1|nr:EamA family transporter [Microbacterium hominis]
MSRSLSVVAVLVAALCFATTGTARALADVDADAVSIGAARVLIGGGLLGLIALARRRRFRADAPPAGLAPSGTGRRMPSIVIVLVGAAGVLAYQPTFFTGTGLNGVAVGTVVALGSAPVVTGVLDALVRRRRPGIRWLIATTVAVLGLVLVSGMFSGGATGVAAITPVGVAASVGAGASYALYAIASKLLLDRGWTAPAAMGAVFGSAAVLSLPVLLSTATAWLATSAGIALALWLGVVTVTVAYLLFGAGLRRLSPATVSTLTLAEPLGATVLGLLVLHEQLAPASIAGLVVIAVGLAIVAVPVRERGSRVSAAA